MKKYFNMLYLILEEILFIAAFILFTVAMFRIHYICGLITLSIILFIFASLVTFIKVATKNNNKRKGV